jgi:carbamoylphosphate synthase large subunit
MAPASILALRRNAVVDLRIVGVDMSSNPAARHLVDVFETVPAGSSPDYAERLLDIVHRENVDVVLPWSDEEAMSVSAAFDLFRAARATPLVSPIECLRLISNKVRTYEELKRHGIPVPEYTVARSVREVERALKRYEFPKHTVVIKATGGRGGRNLHVLCGSDSPPDWLGSGSRETRHPSSTPIKLSAIVDGEVMVMPRLYEPVYDADVYAIGGKVQLTCLRRRTNPTGIPYMGNTLVRNQVVEDFCSRVAKALHLDSVHDMDIMSDRDGNPCLLEVNPRPSGSTVASLAAGHPILQMAIHDALGLPRPEMGAGQEAEIIVIHEVVALPIEKRLKGNLDSPDHGPGKD